jgi:ArsR family transcriptional regulator, lead/cadmium/zinc/bismuth-responsive transcriptional repressor
MVSKSETLKPIDAEAVAQVSTALPVEDDINLVVETFQVLGDPTRLRILYALLDRSLCVRDLAIVVGVSQSAVSHQLRTLRDRRVVKVEREGNIMHYKLDDTHVAALLREALYHTNHVSKGLADHPPRTSLTAFGNCSFCNLSE